MNRHSMHNVLRTCRRTLLLLLALCLSAAVFCMPLSASAKTATTTASGINVARGEGQLIIFTSAYGATTNTNEWGAEAVVGRDHRVTEVGGNNSSIPEGGFVLSGHDIEAGDGMKTWINENIQVGDYVYYNNHTMEVVVSDAPVEDLDQVFYDLTATITGFDRTRYENDMIIFTPSFGTNTKSNEYGYEVAVENGLVISAGGNSTNIPRGENSFVASGHGTSGEWLRLNVRLGMRAEYDRATNTLTFHYDAEGLEKGLNLSLENLLPLLEEAKASYLYMDYDGFDVAYQAAKDMLAEAVQKHNNGGGDRAFADACDEVSMSVQKLNALISESYTVQYRAVWIRPSQRNAEEVEEYVKQLHEQGINTVCIEGNYDNGVIMNVPEDSLFVHNRTFSYDVLQAYIDACHKYGMECHLWMAIYLVGHKNQTSTYTRSVSFKKPEWLSLDQNGSPDNENDFMMIDPANEEAREYLLSFYEYILHNYDLDGFELDYIRYYIRSGEQDFGYTQAAFDGFEEAYHHGVTPTYNPSASYWADWVQYRKDCITKMVEEVRKLIDRWRPEVVLAADVVPNPDSAGVNNYQDYLEWEKRGWLDVLHPMAYGDGFGDSIRKQVELGGERCSVVTGLGVYLDSLGAWDMVRQAIEDNQLGAFGDCYFEASGYLKDNTGAALLQNVYRNEALAPFLDRDASLKAILSYMTNRLDDVLLPLGGVTEEEAKSLHTALENASGAVSDSRIAGAQLAALRDAIAAIENKKAKARLEGDLLYAERIICATYKVNRDALTGEMTPPEGEPYTPPPEEPEESSAPGEQEPSDEGSIPTSEPVTSISGVLIAVLSVLGVAAVALVTVAIVVVVRKKK